MDKNVFCFSLQILCESFLVLRRIQGDINFHYSCLILIRPESSEQIFEESSDVKFYENLSSGSRVVQCGQTDRQTDSKT
jgi:hypothetical protein